MNGHLQGRFHSRCSERAKRVPTRTSPWSAWPDVSPARVPQPGCGRTSRPASNRSVASRPTNSAAPASGALLADPAYVRAAAALDDVDQFDAGFFGFSPREAAILDPQHRHFLECAWEALEYAGYVPERFRGAVGVFGGCGMNGYFMFNLLTNPALVHSVGLFLLRHTGNDKDFLTTRVSYLLDLAGPSLGVQTACSTSLVAIHVASQHLLNGECDLALAGGVTIELPHGVGYLYEEGEILSPDGHCRAFDAESRGTVFGSGVGVVALRRIRDALEDGDVIHAVIKGSAVNNDGAPKVGYLAPSVDGQSAAIREALGDRGVSARRIGYVEAHGTGTPVGDPIEIAALTQAFRQTHAPGSARSARSRRTSVTSTRPPASPASSRSSRRWSIGSCRRRCTSRGPTRPSTSRPRRSPSTRRYGRGPVRRTVRARRP